MNIFVLHKDPQTCAKYHCDKHNVKMLLEYSQMVCSNLNEMGYETPYKTTHKNHPCTIWLRQSIDNWNWLYDLTYHLNEEYKLRYGHTKNHKSWDIIKSLPKPKLPKTGMTPFAQAMPEQYRNKDTVKAYRAYYLGEKKDFATWKTKKPSWWLL